MFKFTQVIRDHKVRLLSSQHGGPVFSWQEWVCCVLEAAEHNGGQAQGRWAWV
jgi:hypothetical protein